MFLTSFLNILALTFASQEFLIPPQTLSEIQISQELEYKDLQMSWCMESGEYFRFKTTHEEVFFELYIPPNFLYSYKWHDIEGEQFNIPFTMLGTILKALAQ